jgi:hypothetical protein
MSSLTQRTFLMRNVHDDAPVLFRTRWALSYLRGPLTLAEIGRLTASSHADGGSKAAAAAPSRRPVVQAGVTERFLRAQQAGPVTYRPRIGAKARAHFVDAKSGMNAWETWYYLAPLAGDAPDWSQADVLPEPDPDFDDDPREGAGFEDAPAAVLSARSHKAWAKALEDHVYRTASVNVLSCPSLKMSAAPGGTESEFRAHIAQALREKRDAAVEALRAKYASKVATLEERERKAEQKLDRERTQASSETVTTALSIGGSLLGALLGGRRSSALRKASTAARSVGRAGKERTDVLHAEADVRAIGEQIASLEAALEAEIARLEAEFDPGTVPVEAVPVRPRKSDLEVLDLALVWCP